MRPAWSHNLGRHLTPVCLAISIEGALMRKRPFLAIVVLHFALCVGACEPGGEAELVPTHPPQGNHFVSPSGSDAAAGTEQQPWRTLQFAANRLQPGDVLLVEDGIYRENVVLTCAGTGDEPITILARNFGAAIVDAGGKSACFSDRGTGLSHVVIGGLVVRNANRGFDLAGPVTKLKLTDCEITDCSNAFLCRQGADLSLERVSVIDCRDGVGLGVKGTSGIEGVTIADCSALLSSEEEGEENTDGFRIEGLCTDVHITDCEAAGFDDSGFDVKPAGALIQRCLAHHNWDNGFKVWGDGARLVNCIARDNDDTGVKFPGAAEMYFCTIAFNRRAAFRPQAERIEDIKVYNTIFAYNFIRQYITNGGRGVFTGDYNLYYAEPDELMWKTMDDEALRFTLDELREGALPLGEHSVFAAPAFISVEDRDLRPHAGSPAKGAGTFFPFVGTDFAGQPRAVTPTIGAWER
ncbi:MAG: hypothetical protein GF393_05285 [Armatimonadia bacterium]|nr:hypothetical protein [Armatimonadia bacterium]